MKRKRFSEAQIVGILREAVVNGVVETARKYKVSDVTLYTWRKRYTGMEQKQVVDLKRLQCESGRLKKLLAERDLEIEVMKEIAAKKW